VGDDGLVVVTGAAGALGHAVLAEFRGRRVVALDRAGQALDEVGADPGVYAVAADLASRSSVADAWSQIDELGTPSALVTLAGGFQPSSLADLTEDLWDAMWRSTVASVLWCAQQAAPRMAAAGGGPIVTMG
jgi:NAD(P)-dependent dehydrogenase (short-subunit alcohol dehydrogenase family)